MVFSLPRRLYFYSITKYLANGTKILLFFPDTHFWAEMCQNIIKEMRG
jgi:hypothetical protein